MSSSPAERDFAGLNLLSCGNTAKGGQATPKAGKPHHRRASLDNHSI